MLVIANVKTDKEWIRSAAEPPFVGNLFLVALIFIPAVVCSFICQAFVPGMNDDDGFTKAMFLLAPLWNFILWKMNIRLYLFWLPSWLLLGIIAVIKAAIMFF